MIDETDVNEVAALAHLVAANTANQMVAPIVAHEGKKQALRAIANKYSAFERLYGSGEWQEVLKDNPALGDAIHAAETNPAFQASLPELYSAAYKISIADRQSHSSGESTATSIRNEMTSAQSTEEIFYQAVESSKETDLSPERRKAIIRELEEKGVADAQW